MADDPEWPLLSALTADQRAAFIAACGPIRHFVACHRLVHLGAPSRGLFLVRCGHLAVITPGEVGEEQIINILGPGDSFGELGLIDGELRSASIETLDDSELYFMSTADFHRFRREAPAIDEALLRYLVQRVRDLSERVTDANRSARFKVVKRLLQTAEAFGVRDPDGVVPVSHATLATMTGVAESTVQYELQRLRRAGLIDQERKQIRLLDPEGLADIADDGRRDEIG